MRVLFLLFAVVLLQLSAAIMEWEHDYAEALQKAKAQQKIFYVFIVSDDCRWCRKMEATTLKDTKIMAHLSSRFVSVELMRDRDEYPKNLQAKMVPKHYFMMPDETKLYSVPGYWNVEDFESILDDVEKKYARKMATQKEN